MKFVLQLILIALVAFILEIFLPWYSIAIAAFVVCVFVQSRVNFLAGFLAIALLWFISAWWIDHNTSSGLADRVAQILPVQKKIYLMLFTALIGGLVGGFAAMTAALTRKPKRRF